MPSITCETNKHPCTCTYPGCARHGKCCECVAYHNRDGDFPGCFFTPEGERTYDRSLEQLIRSRKK